MTAAPALPARLIEALAVTCELTETDRSPAAARIMAEDLAIYPLDQVLAALVRCRRELRGRNSLSTAAVIERLDDGRPGPEEAWAMIPQDEEGSVVWTNEVAEAFGAAWPLLTSGERIPARMAFVERYRAIVARNRAESVAPTWIPSLGRDVSGRESALLEAQRRGRLSPAAVQALLPPGAGAAHAPILRLEDKTRSFKGQEALAEISGMLRARFSRAVE